MCQTKYVPAQSGSATTGCVSRRGPRIAAGSPITQSAGAHSREDDVLEQVDREQVVERDRVERRDEDGEDQREPGHEAGDPPALRPVAPDEQRIAERERRDEDERLKSSGQAYGSCTEVDATLCARA